MKRLYGGFTEVISRDGEKRGQQGIMDLPSTGRSGTRFGAGMKASATSGLIIITAIANPTRPIEAMRDGPSLKLK